MKRRAARKVKSASAARSKTSGSKRAPAQRPVKAAGKKAATKKAASKKATGKKAAVKPQPDAIDAMMIASAQALGLTLDASWQASIKFNLQLVLRHAALVDEFTLPDDAEPAPVFHA